MAAGLGILGGLAGAGLSMIHGSRELERGVALVEEKTPIAFPDCPWALQFNERNYQRATMGEWDWETGMNRHQIDEFESVRAWLDRTRAPGW